VSKRWRWLRSSDNYRILVARRRQSILILSMQGGTVDRGRSDSRLKVLRAGVGPTLWEGRVKAVIMAVVV